MSAKCNNSMKIKSVIQLSRYVLWLHVRHYAFLDLVPWPLRKDTHWGDLEGIVGTPVVNIMCEAWHKQCKNLEFLQDRKMITLLIENVAEVSHRESMPPVVVCRVTIAFLYHQDKPVIMTQYGLRSLAITSTWVNKNISMYKSTSLETLCWEF